MKPPERLLTPLRLSRLAVPLILTTVFVFHALTLRRWLSFNVLPNGFQNEIFHLGNALDLWVAFQSRAWTLVHDLLFAQYWPPLHYLATFPLLAIDIHRDMFVYSNLAFLALLLVSTYLIGRKLESRAAGLLAAVLVSLFPSIYGNLRHFEPNVPLTALVTFSIWSLEASHRFKHRGYSALFGVACGLTLLVDRISGALFLVIPAVVVLGSGVYASRNQPSRRRQVLVHAGLALGLCLLLAGYYYLNFFRFHRDEVLTQAVEGEILASGEHTELRDPLAPTTLLFYPLTLLDSQAGFGLGCLVLAALLLSLWRGERRHRLLWLWLLGALLLYTLIQKKQVYYTIPLLPAVALLAAIGLVRNVPGRIRPILVGALLVVGLHQHQALSFGRGLLPERVLLPFGGLVDLGPLSGRSPLPYPWVAPRYAQSSPAATDDLKVDEILRAIKAVRGELPSFRVETFSEDHTFFEGYLTFFIRCAHPLAIVNGLLQNPQGFYENLRLMDAFVYVTPSRRRFPTEEAIETALRARGTHRYAEGLPILSVLEAQAEKLELRRSLTLSTGVQVHVYGLRPWKSFAPAAPP